jgi:ankyrin repeat protein
MLNKRLIGGVSGFGLVVLLAAAAGSDTRLADAAQKGDKDAVRALLKEKVDVNAAQGDGSTALHWAAFQDDLEMAKMLLAAGANVKAATRINAATPLFMACKNGSVPMIEALLSAGADANAADSNGATPLMMASASGSEDAVKTLVEHKAEVNAKDKAHGQTALMFAASLDRDAVIRVLMDHGADAKLTTAVVKPERVRVDEEGNPIPDAKAPEDAGKSAAPAAGRGGGGRGGRGGDAAEAPPEDSPEVKELGELRTLAQSVVARLDQLEKQMKAADNPPRQQREKGASTIGGMTALLFAARDGQMNAAKALIEKGAEINQPNVGDKTTPLLMSIINGHYDLAKFLVDKGADANLADDLGLLPLYATVDVQWAPKAWFPQPITGQEQATYLDLMKDLMDHGANPNARLGKRLWFRGFGDKSWVDLVGGTVLLRAAVSLDVPAMRLLVAHGADPDIPTKGGDTLLMVCAGLGWGANFSMNVPDGWMPAVKYSLELGADVNAKDAKGYSALHGASYIGNNELVKFLVDQGADVKAVAKDGNTVADMANGPNRFGIPHPETVTLLEKLGSANSHNCRSDQCLVAPKEDKPKDAKSKAADGEKPAADKSVSKPAPPSEPR